MIRMQRICQRISKVASATRTQNIHSLNRKAQNTVYTDSCYLSSYQRVPSLRPEHNIISHRQLCTSVTELSEVEYEQLVEETLDSLNDMFEDLAEKIECGPEYDVNFSSGVLTVCISDSWGTIVINKQTPNKQIWLSSPISGPKRFDHVDGLWVYSHDGCVLHELLSKEVSEATGHKIDFTTCAYGKRDGSNKWSNIGFGEEIRQAEAIEVHFTHQEVTENKTPRSCVSCMNCPSQEVSKAKGRDIDFYHLCLWKEMTKYKTPGSNR